MTFVCARCGDPVVNKAGRFGEEQITVACPRCDKLVEEARKVILAVQHFSAEIDAEVLVGSGK